MTWASALTDSDPPLRQRMLQALVTRRRQLLGMRIAEQQRASGPDKRMRRSLNIVLKALDREFARLDREISLSLMSTMRR